MKTRLHILAAVLLLVPTLSSAQGHIRRAMERARQQQEAMARAQVTSEAGQQSAGRGRMGRSFYSPEDTGVYLSLLLRPSLPRRR